MAKETFGGVTTLFERFQEAGQVASLVSTKQSDEQLSSQNGLSNQFGPQYQLAESDQQIVFPELTHSPVANLGLLESFVSTKQRSAPGAMEGDSGLDWVQDYLTTPTATPTASSSRSQPSQVLTELIKPYQVVRLRYYLDPEVQQLIYSGNANTVLNLFVADHPGIQGQEGVNTFGPAVLKFLKMVLLDSIKSNDLIAGQLASHVAGQIIFSQTIPELRQVAQHFIQQPGGFGNVVRIELSMLYDKFQIANYQPVNDLEDKIFRTFEAWKHHNLTGLHELRNSYQSLSTLTWGQPNLANSMPQQIVEFLISLHGPGCFPAWGCAKPNPHSDTFQLKRFSQDPQTDPRARTIAQHILSRLPQCYDNGLYRDLILLAKRLQVEPVENIIAFLNEDDINLGQAKNQDSSPAEIKTAPRLLDQLTAIQKQQLQFYLEPQVQALIHSGQGRQLAEDFVADKITTKDLANLPPGGLNLLRFLLGEAYLRVNPTRTKPVDFRFKGHFATAKPGSLTALKGQFGNLKLHYKVCQKRNAAFKHYFMAPLKPDLTWAYQRWRDNKQLPGDEYLESYFDYYAKMSDADLAKNSNQDIHSLDADFAYFFYTTWRYLNPQEPDYYDPVRQTIIDKLAKTTTVYTTQLLAKELFKVIPHNTDTPIYNFWAKLVTGLGTTAGNLELTEILNAATETKVTPMPLAAPIKTGYADVVASRQFQACYKDFLGQPTKTKAKLLIQQLAGMTRLVLTKPLQFLTSPDYQELNQALEKLAKVYVSETKAQM